MMKWLAGIVAAIVAIASVFFAGRKQGKADEHTEIIKAGMVDAKETKERRSEALNRSDDSDIDDVVKRMYNNSTD